MRTHSPLTRVLLIEDDEQDFILVRDLLTAISAQRFKLEWAADYDAALDALGCGEFEICLLEYRAGESSALELLQRARGLGSTIPFILLTDQGDSALELEAMQAGAADYLTKHDITAHLLERSIRYAIERKESGEALKKTCDELQARVREGAAELSRANEALQASALLAHATVDALSANIAILDAQGVILSTNESWEEFGHSNHLVNYSCTGVNYLSVCDHARGQWAEEAPLAAAGIREVLSGGREVFELEYPCHSPAEQRWFQMRVTRFKNHAPVHVVVAHDNITERKRMEEARRESEHLYRSLFDNMLNGFAYCRMIHEPDKPKDFIYLNVNSAFESLTGLKNVTGKRVSEVIPGIQESASELLEVYARVASTGSPERFETYIDALGMWFSISVYSPQKDHFVALFDVITERKEAEEFLRVQRDLALGLASSASLVESMELLLEASLRIDALDCGSIYLVDRATGALKLACHNGLSPGFVEQVSGYGQTSPQAQFASQGEPGYWSRPDGIFDMGALLAQEGLRALAVIPVRSEGEVVALLSVASHVQPEIPGNVRAALESVAAQIGGVVSRIRLGEQLKAQSERLQEANAALKVLLRQREQDRAELEESLLENVKHLVLPYLEKLKKSRLTEDQELHLEIVEAHLKEITSSFVRKVAAKFLGLTPAEVRIADFIREGKTSKEIAEHLGTSERAVLFHRQSIRGKLGLKQKKVNLQSYLATLG
jgi:DNA-binding NarL/FixJ family response regulator